MSTSVKRNQTFNFLYAMAIIMVIDDHCSTRIGFLSRIFPYNSFYMPLFVFASGYFFKLNEGGYFSLLKHKIRKLLIPYLLWNVAAMLTAALLDQLTGVDWVKAPSLYTIVYMLGNQSPTSLNGAAWFVNMLFWVSIGYGGFRYILKPGVKNDILLTVFFVITGFVTVELCIKGYPAKASIWLFILRNAFYIQFYHYGYMFRRYGERLIHPCKRIAVCSACVLVNIVMIVIFGDKINFYSTAGMRSFHVWYLPLITSVSGILFYYEIMDYLSGKIGQNPITDFISRNTFTIMQVHLLFVNIPNFYVYFQSLKGNPTYADFPLTQFLDGAWVRYSPDSRLIGFFCGLIGSLMFAYILEKIQKMLSTRFNLREAKKGV